MMPFDMHKSGASLLFNDVFVGFCSDAVLDPNSEHFSIHSVITSYLAINE
ncbi:hypothetical protein MtrunA17_Chr7g0266181 [Medicago truncatula]|uniref:Uncharacterized protein n=1 Tax=Medicago truncatula TaxID=3880 RepID=A0A396HBN2_MEDTR|nr:hypothetical protein MtrunA17_Chr7g0266181 [Medicago truncatula]